MFLIFSIFFYEEFTNISWDEKMNYTEHLPGFILCYAPWCHHCKTALPGFKLFSNKYKNDSRIYIGTIDCEKNEELCDKLNVDGFPTYINTYLNTTSEIWLNHDNPSYERNVQRLIDLSENKYFNNNNVQLETFPHFQFIFQENNKSAVDLASEAISSSDIYFAHSYSMKYGNNNSLTVKLEKNIEITMNLEFTPDNILKFLNENQHAYFGDWSFRSIRRINKKFVIFVDDYNGKDNQANIQQYKSYFVKYAEKYAWGSPSSIKRTVFNSIFNLTKLDYPAAIIVMPGSRRPKFAKVLNVNNEQQLEKALNEKDDNLKLYILDQSQAINKSFHNTMIITAGIIIFFAISLISIILYLKYSESKENTDKID